MDNIVERTKEIAFMDNVTKEFYPVFENVVLKFTAESVAR